MGGPSGHRPPRVFESFDAALDLGVASIARPLGLQLKPTLLIGDPRQGAAVRIVGHPAGGDWSSWDGTVQNSVAAGGDPTHFVCSGSVRLTDGYSGGAVFDAAGRFVGLHSQSSVAYGVGMAGAEILKRLKAWQVPTNEFSADLSPTTIQNWGNRPSCSGSSSMWPTTKRLRSRRIRHS